MSSRCARAIRDRNVTRARVAASARCRSSSTSTTGCSSPSLPSSPRMPSRVRAWRRSGAVVPPLSVDAPGLDQWQRGRAGGGRRRRSPGRGGRRAPRLTGVAQRRADGSHDRPIRLVSVGWPGGRTQDGHRFAKTADPDDRLVEEAGDPDPGGAVQEHGPGASVGGVVESRGETDKGLIAPHEPRARVPGRHGGILRAASG